MKTKKKKEGANKTPKGLGKRATEAIYDFAKANGLSFEQVILNQCDYLVEDPSEPGSFILSMKKNQKLRQPSRKQGKSSGSRCTH